MFYRQCLLVRKGVQQVAWIPEEFAVRGKYVRIRASDGWRVEAVYCRQHKDYVEWKAREYASAFPSIAGM